MKSQDIFILFKLVCLEQQGKCRDGKKTKQVDNNASNWKGWFVEEELEDYNEKQLVDVYSNRSLEALTGVSKSEVNASIKRSISVGMAKLDRKSNLPKVNVRALLEFVEHGLKYVYPAKPSAMVRGIPTSIAAPVLEGKLMSAGEYFYVWPDAMGNEIGQSVAPLYKTVPLAVKKDQCLYEYLALVDAIRLGGSREKAYAIKELKKRVKA